MSGIRLLCDTNTLINLLGTEVVKRIVKKIKQQYKIKLPDAIVAATAIYLDIPLVTFDSDFNKIEGLKLVLLRV